jgi:hypothetical protein
MSKASEYAEKHKAFVDIEPKPFVVGTVKRCYVGEDGRAHITHMALTPAEALNLRDWLTDTFDEVKAP